MVLVNLDFHTRQNFSENYQQWGHAPSSVRQLCPRPKNFMHYVSRGAYVLDWPCQWPHVRPLCTKTPKFIFI